MRTRGCQESSRTRDEPLELVSTALELLCTAGSLVARRLFAQLSRAAVPEREVRRRGERPHLGNETRLALVNGRFRFVCDHCQQGNWAKPESRGRRAPCRTCGTRVTIPDPCRNLQDVASR